MDRQDKWGPWFEHDGKGNPFTQNTLIEVVLEMHDGDLIQQEGQSRLTYDENWDWAYFKSYEPGAGWFWGRIVRYRTPKPIGLTILEGILAALPAPVPERVKEDA